MLKDRLKEARTKAKKTQAQVAEAVGMKQPSYQQIESGKSDSSSFLPDIAKFLNVDVYWLQHGDTAQDSKMMPVTFWDNQTALDDDEFEVPFFKDFLVACGSGNIGEALRSETRKLRMSKLTARHLGVEQPMTAAMTAYGNSMSPKIDDGDTVFIDTSKTKIKDGKIFGICHGGIYRFKYLYLLPFNGVRIVSANADEYPEERLTAQEIQDQDFHVIGQVWSISSLESL
jgi:phage repressor protein C with HTH and peptisase S24 domain